MEGYSVRNSVIALVLVLVLVCIGVYVVNTRMTSKSSPRPAVTDGQRTTLQIMEGKEFFQIKDEFKTLQAVSHTDNKEILESLGWNPPNDPCSAYEVYLGYHALLSRYYFLRGHGFDPSPGLAREIESEVDATGHTAALGIYDLIRSAESIGCSRVEDGKIVPIPDSDVIKTVKEILNKDGDVYNPALMKKAEIRIAKF